MADYYFQMKDLSVGYNGNSLIRDINIGINKGEIVTLIGPNGSGKSTILKSITRQLKVVGGNVFFDDTSLLKLPYKELASKMAVVLTDRIKTELMTCHDIVATGRYPYTGRLGILTQEDECLVEEAMQAVHAQELGNRDFNAISDGQKQRVLLARAICQDPDVIVLDEPTSFLDVKYKLELLSILERMARQKKITVIMSLHEIDLAQKISDKIICVKGEIVTLIGPNGSGKSTILKSITRQLKVVGGNVFFDDTSLLKLPYKELASKMAVVLTDRIKTELMTCHDIVATGRYPYTGRLGILTQEDERLVEEAMQAVHAQELGNRDFNAISDGQKQRVLLARAICQDPDVIVLDEPTSFLDVKYKLELLSILERMARQKKITVIMSLHEIDLAQKISDKIICVKGETISHYGSPEEVFTEEIIRELYGINNGYFDPLFGSIELPAPEGEPEVFVISSGGTGIPVYRRLQKEHIPFAAGILYENDMDYRLARLLAAEVITEEPFEEIREETLQKAFETIGKCKRVINAGVKIGTWNIGIERLLERAEIEGKL